MQPVWKKAVSLPLCLMLLTGSIFGTLEELRGTYRCRWFNPVSGEYGEQGPFRASKAGTHYLGDKPTAADWAIRITAQDRQTLRLP